MTWTHPAAAARFPPSEETFTGSLMLQVARGLEDRGDLVDQVTDLVEEDEIGEVFPEAADLSLDEAVALLDEVVAEHGRVVPATSADVTAWYAALDTLQERGVAFSLGDGWDAREAAQEGYEAARELEGAVGYGYCHLQDLDRVVLTGELYVGFSGLAGDDAEESAAVGRTIVEVLAQAGLAVTWSGRVEERILVAPLAWERRFGD